MWKSFSISIIDVPISWKPTVQYLIVCNTHMHSHNSHGDTEDRAIQRKEFYDYIINLEEHVSKSSGCQEILHKFKFCKSAMIFCGDFNISKTTKEYNKLLHTFSDTVPMRDAHSAHQKHTYASPNSLVSRICCQDCARIDYILLVDEIGFGSDKKVSLVPLNVIYSWDEHQIHGQEISDHFGIGTSIVPKII
jgi:endonuclease/exonuclease/phosphatase family metal-dependent hydrolase